MIRLDLPIDQNRPLTVLCLGAHSDDIEIGCGGTLLNLKQRIPQLKFYWVVFTATGSRALEANRGAELFTEGCGSEIVLKQFRDRYLPYCGSEVKEYFDSLAGQVDPDIIFTHWQGDAHQDHRLLSELTANSFRNHLILEYEIPKFDGDLGRPTVFIPLDDSLVQKKVEHLFDAFRSQQSKRWFDRETFLSLMRIRGMECNSQSGYAEAFHCRKVVL